MFHLIRMHKNPPKGKIEEKICSYRFRFKIQVSCILLSNPEVQNILSLLYFCIVLLWVVLCIDCASLTVSEVAVKCNNNLYVRGDEADPAQHSAGGSGRKARNV